MLKSKQFIIPYMIFSIEVVFLKFQLVHHENCYIASQIIEF